MDPLARRMHRLRYETRDWCTAVQTGEAGRLDLHRDSIQWRPEVWDDV